MDKVRIFMVIPENKDNEKTRQNLLEKCEEILKSEVNLVYVRILHHEEKENLEECEVPLLKEIGENVLTMSRSDVVGFYSWEYDPKSILYHHAALLAGMPVLYL